MNILKATYWTDQQTGKLIGPLYSWNDIREEQLQENIRVMLKRKKATYVKHPSVPKQLTYECVDYYQAVTRLPKLPNETNTNT